MNFQNSSSLFYHDRVAHAQTMCGVVYSHAHHRVGTATLACQRGLMVIVPRPRYACTPTEVHTNPDRGTHVSRPRYAHFTTEMSIHHDQDEHTRRPKCGDQAAPTTYYSPIKKAQLSSKLCLFCGGGEKREEGVRAQRGWPTRARSRFRDKRLPILLASYRS